MIRLICAVVLSLHGQPPGEPVGAGDARKKWEAMVGQMGGVTGPGAGDDEDERERERGDDPANECTSGAHHASVYNA